jgi:hypothetical protein
LLVVVGIARVGAAFIAGEAAAMNVRVGGEGVTELGVEIDGEVTGVGVVAGVAGIILAANAGVAIVDAINVEMRIGFMILFNNLGCILFGYELKIRI